MRRRAKYSLFIFLAAFFLGVAGAVVWLVGTTDGARWLLQTVSRHTPLRLVVRNVEGRLLDQLRLENVRFVQAPLTIEIDKLDFRWQPVLLLAGRFAARELTLSGVRIQDNTPGDIPPDLAWPRVSGMSGFFKGQIGRLQIKGLSYRHRDQPPQRVDAISASLSWHKAHLLLSNLLVLCPVGRLSGSIDAGLLRPSLRFDLLAFPAQPPPGLDTASLQGRFVPGQSSEQLAGGFNVSLWSGNLQRLELTGEAGMTRKLLNLRRLRLTRPGRRGQITGGGTITPTTQAPLLALQLQVAGLDLAPELKMATDLNGWIKLVGTTEQYRGRFVVANRGVSWRALQLTGEFQGDPAGMKFVVQRGALLAGTVKGNLDVGWRAEPSLMVRIQGREINPAGLAPGWRGAVNFDLAGNLLWPRQAPLQGEVKGRLLESRLHGRNLTGEIAAQFAHGDLRIERLLILGKGFNLNAQGELGKRLVFTAQVGDLSRLIPQTAGEIRATGWVRRRDRLLEGDLTAQGSNLSFSGIKVAAANLSAGFGQGKDDSLRIALKLLKPAYNNIQGESVTLETEGTTKRHTWKATLHSTFGEAYLVLSGTYGRKGWQGEVIRFSGRDSVGSWSLGRSASLSFAAGTINLSPLVIRGGPLEYFEIGGELTGGPLRGSMRLAWERLELARANPWLKETHLAGTSAGNIRIEFKGGGRPTFTGTMAARGMVTMAKAGIHVQQGSLKLTGGAQGLHAVVGWRLAGGGEGKGAFNAPGPAYLVMPEQGDLSGEWQEINLALFRDLLPRTVNLEGRINGRAKGKLLPGQQFALTGTASLVRGKARWLRPGGELNVDLNSASLAWDWRGERLQGTALLTLAQYGQARASFQLPFSARFPPSLNRQGNIQVSLAGQAHEKGLLSSLFPGFIRESQGEIEADLRIIGSWEAPEVNGSMLLAKAGAYLPAAGIHVRDVRLALRLEKDLIHVDSFHAASGPGYISGEALIQLKGWQVAGYHGSISGDRFQVTYLPELRVLSTPHLTFTGSAEKLVVRGEVDLPELLIAGRPAGKTVLPSKDVIIEGTAQPVAKILPLALDVQVSVILGDNVQVKMEGIDARLEGKIDLIFQNFDKITSRGEIRVVKGRYKAYGVDLEIVRGRFTYAGTPINEPTLDILALRTSGEVRAGIMAGGILRAPVIKLYSEPALPEVDILAYIAFGHAAGSGAEQAAVLAQTAGVLLSRGHSDALQEQIKQRLGLSTLAIQSGNGEATGRSGYRQIPATPPGVTPTKQAGDLSQAMLTLGKYLTPRIYFSYGRSLFTGSNIFLLRYDLFKRWQVETQTGTTSSVDLYYKIDFK